MLPTTEITQNPICIFHRFDLLLKVVGKPLPANIYALITYIESNILEPREKSRKKPNPQADKAKVLRETKLIPKIILCIENFNKHVILLAKKTNNRLANFLHFGTVRDFRIKTADLKKAIDRTLTQSSQIELVDSALEDEHEELQPDIEEEEQQELASDAEQENVPPLSNNSGSRDSTPDLPEHEQQKEKAMANTATTVADTMSPYHSQSIRPIKRKKTQKHSEDNQALKENVNKVATEEQPTSSKKAKKDKSKTDKASKQHELSDHEVMITPESEEFLENESNKASCTQMFSNLDKINKKAAKKRTLHSAAQDADVLCAAPAEPKAKRPRKGAQQPAKRSK